MGPYEGIRILEISESIAASFGSMLLAELGADVVKVEPPSGDPMRAEPGFHVWNRNKRSVALDMERDGRKLAQRLAAEADVVVTDFLPGEGRRLGLTYADIKESNPAVVYCGVPPMGGRGPRAHLTKDDDLVGACSGAMCQQWSYSGRPVYLTIPIPSCGAALLAAAAVGAALYSRQRTGIGQAVEVSWLAGAIAMHMGQINRQEAMGEISFLDRNAPRGGQSVVYRAYQASDGWIFLGCASPVFAHRLFVALGIPELLSDPRYADLPWGISREHRLGLQQTIDAIMSGKTVAEWLSILREQDIPCSPVLSRQEFVKHPQVVCNGMMVELDDPELGRTLQMNVPVGLSLTPARVRRPAPRLGEHNAEILAELERGRERRLRFGNAPVPVGPLSGVKVIDLTNYAAGPIAFRVLAELGADVVKVESLEGDPLRLQAFTSIDLNRGKRSIALDLKTPEGRKTIREMMAGADILGVNFRPGVAERLNIGYETAKQINPGLIYYSGTAWGKGGPHAGYAAFDPLIQATCGIMRAQGGEGQEPAMIFDAIHDHATPLQACCAILAALFHRERTGCGQMVESSLLSSALTVQSGSLIFYEGRPAEPDGGRDFLGLSALCRLYEAADGWLMLSVKKAEQWPGFCTAIGMSDLALKYLNGAALAEPAAGGLASVIEQVFLTRSRAGWLDCLNEAGIPCAPALSRDEVFHDAQVEAEGLFELEDNPGWGRLWVTSHLVKFSATPGPAMRRTPTIGEHTAEILGELGLNPAQIAELRSRSAVRQSE